MAVEIIPDSGTEAGGTYVILLSNSYFTDNMTVTFGGISASNVEVANSSRLTCYTNTNSPGTVDVVATRSDGFSLTYHSAFTFTVASPTIFRISPTSGTAAGGTTVTITGRYFQSGATVRFNNSAATDVMFISSTTLTAVTPASSSGTASVKVTNPDNQSTTLSHSFTYITPSPSITSINPTSGTTAGGTSVTITGSGFQSGATISFGGSAGTSVVLVSSTSLTAVTPAHSSGTVSVTVTNPDNQADTLLGAFTFANPSPTITSLNPDSGNTGGSTSVIITGSNFQNGATVNFGSSAATSVIVTSSTSLTAITPTSSAGVVSVTVTNPDNQSGTLSNSFTFIDPSPTITSINPYSGPEAGGTDVTITGSNFQDGATVDFGNSTARDVVFVSSASLTAVTPAHSPGIVSVTVRNPDGLTDTLSTSFAFVAPAPPPVITSISPNSGTESGGTVVIITGSAFQSGATVSFANSPSTGVIFVSDTILTAITPAHGAVTVDIIIRNPDGNTDTLSGAFTFIALIPAQDAFIHQHYKGVQDYEGGSEADISPVWISGEQKGSPGSELIFEEIILSYDSDTPVRASLYMSGSDSAYIFPNSNNYIEFPSGKKEYHRLLIPLGCIADSFKLGLAPVPASNTRCSIGYACVKTKEVLAFG